MIVLLSLPPLGTYDVQQFNITNPSIGQMCVYCYFVLNSTAKGCLVSYQHINTNVINNMTIMRTFEEHDITDCIEHVTDGYYNILVYDIEENSSNNSAQLFIYPAVTINDVMINGITIIDHNSTSIVPTLLTTTAPTVKNGNGQS